MGMFDGFTAGGIGTGLQALGSLAGAWGSYESQKKTNQFLQDQFNYEKSKDDLAKKKLNTAQVNLESAFDGSLLGNKKKKTDGTIVSDSANTSSLPVAG